MTGKLANKYCGLWLKVQVLQSAAGFYLGTANEDGPVSRESEEYWLSMANAQQALENNTFTQRTHP